MTGQTAVRRARAACEILVGGVLLNGGHYSPELAKAWAEICVLDGAEPQVTAPRVRDVAETCLRANLSLAVVASIHFELSRLEMRHWANSLTPAALADWVEEANGRLLLLLAGMEGELASQLNETAQPAGGDLARTDDTFAAFERTLAKLERKLDSQDSIPSPLSVAA